MAGAVVLMVLGALTSLALAVWQYRQFLRHQSDLWVQFAEPAVKQGGRVRGRLPGWVRQLAFQCEPLGKRYSLGLKGDLADRLLKQAGNPYGLEPREFFGLKGLFGLAALILGMPFSLVGVSPIFAALLALAGVFGPDVWLKRVAAARQRRIALDLPDFLDVTSVCLQAGIPLDPAIRVVVNRMDGPLSEELARYLHEVSLGTPRESALRGVIDRNDCPELRFLMESLLQGLELGVPIAQAIAAQARDLRGTRTQKAKAQAARASPQVTLVTTFVITPAVFAFIVALLVLNFIYNPDRFGLTFVF